MATVKRDDLYEAAYQKSRLSRAESVRLVESVFKEISKCLERGETVKLSAFGSFVVRNKGQRMGCNPKTGEKAVVSARRGAGVQAVRVSSNNASIFLQARLHRMGGKRS